MRNPPRRKAPMQQLKSLKETCNALGVSKHLVYRLIANGGLRPVKIGDRTLFRPEDVETFVERSLAPKRTAE